MSVLVTCMVKRQHKSGLERPFGKDTQMPMQFLRLFARVVVSFGSVRISGGAGTSRISLFRFGSDMVRLDSLMVFMVFCLMSRGIGSECRVIFILFPPMVSGFLWVMHKSRNAAWRTSEVGL